MALARTAAPFCHATGPRGTVETLVQQDLIVADVLEVWFLQFREIGGLSNQPSRPTAYCIGNAGWVADDPLVTFANGVAQEMAWQG